MQGGFKKDVQENIIKKVERQKKYSNKIEDEELSRIESEERSDREDQKLKLPKIRQMKTPLRTGSIKKKLMLTASSFDGSTTNKKKRSKYLG